MTTSTTFSTERADHAQRFFERLLFHTKGRFARAPFLLAEWQRDQIVRPLFGNTRFDEQLDEEVRQYKVAWIELGRKNGKSELLAGIALYLLCADREEGAEVYGAACDRDQATLVFRVAKRMVELSPALSKRLTVIDSRKRIIDPRTDSFYEVIAADAAGNLGQNPHGIVFDEVIAQKSRDLWDALKTGMGARSQPLMVAATTAGNDPHSFAAEEHEYSRRVAEDPSIDPSRFVFMRNTPKDVDWRDESKWYEANPALGDFLSIEALREEAREAELKPSAENAFRQFRLNQWVQQTVRWLPIHSWDECGKTLFMEGDLAGQQCYAGMDLVSTKEVTAWSLVFPQEDGSLRVLWRFWTPESSLQSLDNRTGGKATAWVRAGWLKTTEGDVIDYAAIGRQIDADATTFDIQEVGFNPWDSTQLVQSLSDGGLVMVPVRQTTTVLSDPTKDLERLVVSGQLHHNNNPVARWMADNVVIRRTDDQLRPDRNKSAENISGISALVTAMERLIRTEGEETAQFIILE